MEQKQLVYDKLSEMKIPYNAIEHEAVFTIEEMKKLDFPEGCAVAKNLFLRDAKGKRHFLLATHHDQSIDLKSLGEKFGSTKLSFASDERLSKYLGVTKGAVSPLGLLNDSESAVEFYIDEALRSCNMLGVHPNDNTATVFIDCSDLIKLIQSTNHKVNFLKLS